MGGLMKETEPTEAGKGWELAADQLIDAENQLNMATATAVLHLAGARHHIRALHEANAALAAQAAEAVRLRDQYACYAPGDPGVERQNQLIEEHKAMKLEVERLRVALAKSELERASAISQRDELAKAIG